MESFAGRLKWLVEHHFDGSQRSAAAAWDVSQSTLSRHIAGKGASSPRADFVYAIAEYHHLSPDWLVRGVGKGPDLREVTPEAEQRDWRSFVRELGVNGETELALEQLPRSIAAAYRQLAMRGWQDWIPSGKPGQGGFAFTATFAPVAEKAAWEASAAEVRAWLTLLRGLQASYGREALARKLESEVDAIRIGFNRFGLFLLDRGELDTRLFADEEEGFVRDNGRVVIGLEKRAGATPPLEVARLETGQTIRVEATGSQSAEGGSQ